MALHAQKKNDIIDRKKLLLPVHLAHLDWVFPDADPMVKPLTVTYDSAWEEMYLVAEVDELVAYVRGHDPELKASLKAQKRMNRTLFIKGANGELIEVVSGDPGIKRQKRVRGIRYQ